MSREPGTADPSGTTSQPCFDRRVALKLLGTGAIAVPLYSGVAAAHEIQFFGCSQVCADSRGLEAVVDTDGGYGCRGMDRTSTRRNVDWSNPNSYCYEVDEGESIVGVIEGEGSECTFCVNPNNCASSKYDSVEDIVEDLVPCSSCTKIVVGNCTVSGTGGGNGNGPNGNQGVRVNGN